MKTDTGLYIHIPFCARKCNYCDFLSFAAGNEERAKYVDSLVREINEASALRSRISVPSIYIGGGTPSILDPGQIGRIMDAVHASFDIQPDAEISVEANPGTLDADVLAQYRLAGINRLSMGLQSADDDELRLLGRIHDWGSFVDMYRAAREQGFDNINIDIMWGLPGQTVPTYVSTLKKVTGLSPEHISAYSLILEEGTPFYENMEQLEFPDEEEELSMYNTTLEYLADQGYGQYEISNFARPGRECLHNISYWRRTPYLGFGIGAASLMKGTRWRNTSDMAKYICYFSGKKSGLNNRLLESICFDDTGMHSHAGNEATDNDDYYMEEIHFLTEKEEMEEHMFLGLRMNEGVAVDVFEERFGVNPLDIYAHVIRKYTGMGMLQVQDGRIRLSSKGIHVSNVILAEFLL